MDNLIAGKVSDAVDQYLKTNPLVSQKQQQLENLKVQIEGSFRLFGNPMSYELVLIDDFSMSLKRFVFISKHQYHALSWEFYVYKPQEKWIANNMNFSDNFKMLESKMK